MQTGTMWQKCLYCNKNCTRKSTSCLEYQDDQLNQLALVTGSGTGCLDPFDDIPEDWFGEIYSWLPVRQVVAP